MFLQKCCELYHPSWSATIASLRACKISLQGAAGISKHGRVGVGCSRHVQKLALHVRWMRDRLSLLQYLHEYQEQYMFNEVDVDEEEEQGEEGTAMDQ